MNIYIYLYIYNTAACMCIIYNTNNNNTCNCLFNSVLASSASASPAILNPGNHHPSSKLKIEKNPKIIIIHHQINFDHSFFLLVQC